MASKRLNINGMRVEARVDAGVERADDPEFWPSLGEYPVYDAFLYAVMTHDTTRNEQYTRAIQHQVRGKSVIDIGTGQDLNWARACIEAGARKVYAVEALDEPFRKASLTLQKLGLEHKITLLKGSSFELDLPEKVDVCVSELIGTIASSEGVAAVLNDARQRFLKPEAALIPRRAVTRIAAASLPKPLHERPGFRGLPLDYVERLFHQVGGPFDFRLCIRNFDPSNVLSRSEVFEQLDFGQEVPTFTRQHAELSIEREGRLDGLLLWVNLWCGFGTECIDSLNQQTNWLPIFLPVFYPGIRVTSGDAVSVVWECRLSDDGIHPDYVLRGVLKTSDQELPFQYASQHHTRQFRGNALYRTLFPEALSAPP